MIETNYGIVLDCELEDTSRSNGVVAELIFDDVPIRSTTAKGFKTASRPITKFLKKKRGSEKTKVELPDEDTNENDDDSPQSKNTWKGPKINFTQAEVEASQIVAEQIQLAPEPKKMLINEDAQSARTTRRTRSARRPARRELYSASTVGRSHDEGGARLARQRQPGPAPPAGV